MVDFETFYAAFPKSIPRAMEQDDIRDWVSDCTCEVCRRSKQEESQHKRIPPLFVSFGNKSADFSPQELLLMPTSVSAYVFRTREWGE